MAEQGISPCRLVFILTFILLAVPFWNLVMLVVDVPVAFALKVALELARHLAEVLDRKEKPVEGQGVPHRQLALDQ
jgi:hypothetical protein